jgi:nucleosome binding factor SPN SPT16 subunit
LFTFQKSTIDSERFRELKEALQDFNIAITESHDDINWASSSPILWTLIDPPSNMGAITDLSFLELDENSFSLPFEIRY